MEPIQPHKSSLRTQTSSRLRLVKQEPRTKTFTQQEVAELLGCSVTTLTRRFKKWGVNPQGRKLTLDLVKNCFEHVGLPFDIKEISNLNL